MKRRDTMKLVWAGFVTSLSLIPSQIFAQQAQKEPKKANSDAPFAEGWPDSTKPGTIEVKQYPAYRSAIARAKNASMGADGVLFFSLFRHITQSNVEMTSPVVNTYEPKILKAPTRRAKSRWNFSIHLENSASPGRAWVLWKWSIIQPPHICVWECKARWTII
jgi:hypothetical protein